ncbi:hypothetical protein [Mesorhizobium sp. RMAD-H1]|uniref:hypothetical protein n=1 Tax=Mesorhizobium sp. RMAD-H1 TaxID=2587065 RepID=UPI001608B3A8|nr:hypothetical protein [Mesorhizobium sp. RMAD-H1]MBB2969841.1 hypothetical protein [Mesorhizobium sp. RMAD-H1]
MRTIRRVSTLAALLDEIQSELGRAQVEAAQRLAAEMAGQLEDWRFDLLRIPHEERSRYQAPNGYWYTKEATA